MVTGAEPSCGYPAQQVFAQRLSKNDCQHNASPGHQHQDRSRCSQLSASAFAPRLKVELCHEGANVYIVCNDRHPAVVITVGMSQIVKACDDGKNGH